MKVLYYLLFRLLLQKKTVNRQYIQQKSEKKTHQIKKIILYKGVYILTRDVEAKA